ncbi:MAG TPA: DUF2513 domain-containing protein [Candidatus Hydrogenedentes bacterium]|nr:DUF2513 domain-containing protein [Candidatus Hydrogenedentota bacterium]
MQRDMDLIRKMLMDLEDGGNRAWEGRDRKDPEHAARVKYHAFVLVDAGYAQGVDVTGLGSAHPESELTSLTWAGHEFLDAARDEGRWKQAKALGAGVGGMAVSVLKELLVSLAKKQLGLP